MEDKKEKALVIQASEDSALLLCHGGQLLRMLNTDGWKTGEEVFYDPILTEENGRGYERKAKSLRVLLKIAACLIFVAAGLYATLEFPVHSKQLMGCIKVQSNIYGTVVSAQAINEQGSEVLDIIRNGADNNEYKTSKVSDYQESVRSILADLGDESSSMVSAQADVDAGHSDSVPGGLLEDSQAADNTEVNESSEIAEENTPGINSDIQDQIITDSYTVSEVYYKRAAYLFGYSNNISDIYSYFLGVDMLSTPIDNEGLIELLFFYPPEYTMPNFDSASVYLYDLTEDKIIEAVMTNDLVKNFSPDTGFSNSARLLINGSDMKEFNSYYVKIDGVQADGNIIDNINFVFMYVTGGICLKTGDTQPGTIYFPGVGGSDVSITKTEIYSGESTIVFPSSEKIIHWQDPAVEAIVRQALNKETGDITIAEATRYVGSLVLYRNDIKTLADLKWFPNAGSYFIRADLLQDASLLRKGAYIELFFDGVTSLSDIDKLCNIEEINKLDSYGLTIRPNGDNNATYAFGNTLVSLQYTNSLKDFSGAEALLKFKKLMSLDLSGNGINDISKLACLSGISTLSILNLSGNNLSDIGVIKDFKNITSLFLKDNQIKDISYLGGLTDLRWIMLSNNRLEDISALSGLKQLDYIFLSNNQIKDISPLQGLNPSTLDLSWNQITDITSLENMKGLSVLFLANNAISDISSLKNLDRTVDLSLYNNPVEDWSYVDHIEKVDGRPN